jgi:predicted ribosomally synthesized peptide with SipW-like signal peptide
MDRKILTAFFVIGLVATMAGAGLYAYFSDTETSRGNTFTVDIGPDLELGPCGTQPYLPFNVADIKPGDSGVADVNLHNAGTDGWLSMKIINCVNDENVLMEPEAEAGDGSVDVGELGSKLYLVIWFDDNNNGVIDGDWPSSGEQPIAIGYVDELCGIEIPIDGSPFQSGGYKTYEIMGSGVTWTIGFKWSLASDVGNIVQSDSLSFDIEFTLKQPT